MHDTTAATMSLCLMELARRPALQAKVAAEATSILGEKGSARAMTYDDLSKMPLLTKCINETLRVWPAVAYGTQRMLEKVCRGSVGRWLLVGAWSASWSVFAVCLR
jgi:cytochrome P450 family 6